MQQDPDSIREIGMLDRLLAYPVCAMTLRRDSS